MLSFAYALVPSVSRMISSLEQEVGTQLLTRTTRAVALIEAGGIFWREWRAYWRSASRRACWRRRRPTWHVPARRSRRATCAGTLVRLLPDWDVGAIEVNAVFSAGRASKPSAKAFVEYIRPRLEEYGIY